MNGDVAIFRERVTAYLSITPLYNATGTPAMSVPLHWTDDGLPVGVHFAGRYGEEASLLELAAQPEQAQPWFDRLPPL
jgi:amidase